MMLLTLPYPVSANRYWHMVRIGPRTAIALTKEARAYKAQCQALAKVVGMHEPLHGRLALHVKLFPARPQDWSKRAQKDPDHWADTVRCMDLGNCEKVLSDALNGIAWVDDKQLHRITLERCDPDEHGDRVQIRIERLVVPSIAPQLFAEAS